MQDQLDQLKDAGTSVIADMFDRLGVQPIVLDNHLQLFAGSQDFRIAGPAYTVVGEYQTWERGPDREKLMAIDQMPEGVVALWAGNDVTGVCLFGDLLAAAMKVRGCKAIIVDGGIRDLAELRKLDLPVLARYRSPAQSITRWHVTDYQVSVQVAGALEEKVTVHAGDIIVADPDGVIVVPQNQMKDIAEAVSKLSDTESKVRQEVLNGLPILEALEKFGLP